VAIALPSRICADKATWDAIADAACWAALAKIPRASFYDPSGVLLEKRVEVTKAILSRARRVLGSDRTSTGLVCVSALDAEFLDKSLSTSHRPCSTVPRSPVCSCAVVQPDLRVNLVSSELGRAHLARVVRHIHTADPGMDPTFSHFDKAIAVEEFPEPQLLMITCRNEVELDSFPPWPLRLTEIHLAKRRREAMLDYHDFHAALRRFAGCSQRFGR